MSVALSVRDLRFSYGGPPVLDGVSFDLGEGEFLGVIGPNGVGKSTLLRLVLGILEPGSGEVLLRGEPVLSLPRREVALRAAFLPQGVQIPFAFRVEEVVAMGRTPHLGRFRPEGAGDRDAVRRSMERTQTLAMAQRPVTELSGGESQRVFLARALAQTVPVLVLDEPTANLDLLHGFQLAQLVRAEVSRGAAAMAALHDLNLAARSCDRILLLAGGRVAALGTPEEVLTPGRLAEAFGVRALVERDAEGRLSVGVLGPA